MFVGLGECTTNENEMESGGGQSDPIGVTSLDEAKGANQMLLSPNGRWLALSYMLHDDAPLLVRIDRQRQTEPTVERGFLGESPADDGTLYYVQQESPNRAQLLLTPAGDRWSYLRRWGDPRRLFALQGAYGVHSVGAKHVILFGGGDDYDEVVVVADSDEVVARRNFSELGHIVSRAFDDRYVYLLLDQPHREGAAGPKDRLSIIKLDAITLDESWRKEEVAPAIIFTHPQLHIFDHGKHLLLTSNSSSKMAMFATTTGTAPRRVLDCPAGPGLLSVMATTQPAEAAFIIWRSAMHGAHGWKILRVSETGVEVVVDRPDDIPPASGIWDESRALIAESGGVTPGEPNEWDPVVRSYLDMLPGSGP